MFKDVKFHFQNFFSIFVFTSCIGGLILVSYLKPPPHEGLGMLQTFFITSASTAISYAIGSSKGSAVKDKAIQEMTRSAAKVDAAEPSEPNVLPPNPPAPIQETT